MTLLGDIGRELLGMFLADVRLSGAVLALVAIVAMLTESHSVQPLVSGAAFLLGSLGILVFAAWREGRRRQQS